MSQSLPLLPLKWSQYREDGAGLAAIPLLPHLFLATTLRSSVYYSPFTGEETRIQRE